MDEWEDRAHAAESDLAQAREVVEKARALAAKCSRCGGRGWYWSDWYENVKYDCKACLGSVLARLDAPQPASCLDPMPDSMSRAELDLQAEESEARRPIASSCQCVQTVAQIEGQPVIHDLRCAVAQSREEKR